MKKAPPSIMPPPTKDLALYESSFPVKEKEVWEGGPFSAERGRFTCLKPKNLSVNALYVCAGFQRYF